jgi:hypothetical protein
VLSVSTAREPLQMGLSSEKDKGMLVLDEWGVILRHTLIDGERQKVISTRSRVTARTAFCRR